MTVEVKMLNVDGSWWVVTEDGDLLHDIGKGWSRNEAQKRFDLYVSDHAKAEVPLKRAPPRKRRELMSEPSLKELSGLSRKAHDLAYRQPSKENMDKATHARKRLEAAVMLRYHAGELVEVSADWVAPAMVDEIKTCQADAAKLQEELTEAKAENAKLREECEALRRERESYE